MHRSEETKRKISEANKGKRKGVEGYWNGKHRSEETVSKMVDKKSKRVLCVETNTIYKSATEVYRMTGISQQGVSAVCNGQRKTAGGYHWEFVEKEN
jgi:D-hexose-6-phosphate mutarotase